MSNTVLLAATTANVLLTTNIAMTTEFTNYIIKCMYDYYAKFPYVHNTIKKARKTSIKTTPL